MRRIKRFFAACMALCILSGITVEAAEVSKDAPVDTTATTPVVSEEERAGKTADEIYAMEAGNEEAATENAYNMKIDSNGWQSWPQGPGTYGEAAIVMEAKTGAILYAKNIDGKAYPASITKVLTMLVALENAKLEDKVTFTNECIDFLEYGDAHIGMAPGEEITLNDALHALLLASANEVAYAIGSSVGDGYDWFIGQMNARAKELGAVNSNFLNTNGLNDENHYTTAHDMALITRELYVNHEEFKTISQTLQYTIPPTNLQPESRTFQQKHKMFYDWDDNYYEYVTAGKTGYTEQALNTLITCADNGDMPLICVVMKTHGRHVYPDTRALFDYAYQNFHKVNIKQNEKSGDFSKIEDEAYVVLPEGVEFSDLKAEIIPDKKNARNGTVTYTYNDSQLGSAEVTFSKEYLKENAPEVVVAKKEKKQEKGITIPSWLKWVALAAGVVVVLLLIWFFVALYIRKKRREERRRRRRRRSKRRR